MNYFLHYKMCCNKGLKVQGSRFKVRKQKTDSSDCGFQIVDCGMLGSAINQEQAASDQLPGTRIRAQRFSLF
jgi:hypothetical protein